MNSQRAHEFHSALAGVSVGGWFIGDIIGHGGSAAVFSAEREGIRAAVKIIDPQLIDEFGREAQRRRIEIEAGLVGHDHPNLIRLFEAGECPDTQHLYVAMEELPYRNLSKIINIVPADAVGRIIEQVASAAKYLDERGICHRDIKPDNVMVSDDCSRAVLMDLGIVLPFGAAAAGDVDSSGERFIGTARYCPREFLRNQVAKSAVGHRAVTFYQLGGLLHDMIMRKRLFDHIDWPYAVLIDAIDKVTPIVESEEVRPHLVYLARDCLRKVASERGRLVDWERFSASEPNASLDARARVRASQQPTSTVVDSEVGRQVHIDRRQLQALGRSLRARLAALCEGNSDLLIPSIDVDVVGQITRLTTEFEPDPARGIHRCFRIVFFAEPIEGPDLVFTLDAEVRTGDQASAEAPSPVRVCILRGIDSDPSIDLEDFLYKVIADLMGQPDEPTGGKDL